MVPGIGNADRPTAGLVGGIAEREDTAAGGGDESVAKASRAEDRDHAIHGVAFAHSAWINLDTSAIEMHGSLASVQMNVLVSHQLERPSDLFSRWNATARAEKSPCAHERTDCQIESAFTGAA